MLALSSIKDLKDKSNGFFYLATIGDFHPARNGHFRPALTITVDRIVFSGFKYQDQIVEKTVCTGLPGYNAIGWMILPNGNIDICIDIYYDNEIFSKFWEFSEWNLIGSFDICLYLTNKSVSGLTYREQIYISKGTNMKEHVTYKAYVEEHPDT